MSNTTSRTVSTALIDYRLQIAERLKGDRRRILDRAGVSASEITDLSGSISLEKERSLWRAMKEETGREDIGLQCGLHFPVQSMGMIGYVMMNAATMRKALEHFCRFQRMVGDSMGMKIEEKYDYTTLHVRLWTPWHEELRYTTDVFLAATMSWIKKNSSSQPGPLRAGFHYRRPQNADDYTRTFHPAPVEFGCNTSYLVYETADLEASIISANRELFQHDALDALHNLSHGIPRQINRLADLALLVGFAEDRPAIEAAQLEAIADELVTVAAA
jgi:hypothetical protein